MARKSDTRTRLVVGLFVLVCALLLFVSLFIIGQSEGTWKPKAQVFTDFKTITGLRTGSPVQLAGVEVGTVEAITFERRKYACDPLTEDVGRWGGGRTDNCDEFLFCSPESLCAELEPYASKSMHSPCLSSEDCGPEEICVTKEFRRRARRVFWTGPDGVCARYTTEHRRVEVAMSVYADKLDLIRTDSRATVASNGVLGDQLVNITPGSREPLDPENRRVQSTPSLYEDIELFRERIDGLTDRVDSSLSAVSSLFSELNDERVIGAVKGTIEHVNEISRQVAEGEGVVGALLSDDAMKEDVSKTLRSVRNTAVGIDQFVGKANRSLGKIDQNLQPAVDDAREVMADIRQTLDDIQDPSNKSLLAKLLYDKEGQMTQDVETIMGDLKETSASAKKIAKKIEDGEGTLGKLVNDSKPHDDIVKIFRDLERNTTFKSMTRRVIELDEADQRRNGASK